MLVLTIGATGSGKTTWANDMVRHDSTFRRFERDEYRKVVAAEKNVTPYGKGWDNNCEMEVTQRQKSDVAEALKYDFNVIVSDTNLNEEARRSFKKMAEQFDVPVYYVHFFVSREELHRRNQERPEEDKVPEDIVDKFYHRHVEMAPFNDGFNYYVGAWYPNDEEPIICYGNRVPEDTKVQARENRENMEKCVIFDIDGTLALRGNRSPFEFNKVHLDKLNDPVAEALELYRQKGYYIVIVSGREGTLECRVKTEQWLHDNGIRYDYLFMRKEGDHIKDNVVKHDIFLHKIYPYWVTKVVYDDRDQTVRMWRDMNCTTFQVADGNF